MEKAGAGLRSSRTSVCGAETGGAVQGTLLMGSLSESPATWPRGCDPLTSDRLRGCLREGGREGERCRLRWTGPVCPGLGRREATRGPGEPPTPQGPAWGPFLSFSVRRGQRLVAGLSRWGGSTDPMDVWPAGCGRGGGADGLQHHGQGPSTTPRAAGGHRPNPKSCRRPFPSLRW